MRPNIEYDFSEFEKIMLEIKQSETVTGDTLNDLKLELNSFFKDSTCKEVIYTENVDKMLFGMVTMPHLTDNMVIEILQGEEPIRIESYYVELDSKLFSSTMNLSVEELVSILLYEVGALVNSSEPIKTVRDSICYYLSLNSENLMLPESVYYANILAFGIKDTIRKCSSLFEFDSENKLVDEFVEACGYSSELHSAYKTILTNGGHINSKVSNKLIILSWTMRLYKDVKIRRISAIKELTEAKLLAASKLEKRELENIIRVLNRIDDSMLLESGTIDDISNKYNKTLKNIKYKGIRSLEDDLFEYRMRARNVEDENDALFILRSINTRLAIIDDYISTERLEEKEQKRWFELYDSFAKIREDLSKKQTYRDRPFGIIVQYPDIKPNRM